MIDTQSLKNKILDLAIRGKLTRQLPDDGTAEELYEKIQEEKQALVEAGKIKKEKPLKEIEEGEVPFEIPESWMWVKLSEVSYLTSGGQYEEIKEGIPYVKVADMNSSENQYEIIKSTRYVDKCNTGIIPKGSIIFPKRGGAIATNKKRLVNETEIYVDTNIMGMTIIYPPTMSYIKIWFDSIDLGMLQSGTSIPQINNKDLYPLLIPLPPLAEQKRIVEIVEKLFVEIDTIKKLQTQYAADAEILKSKLIDAAIQGKLTEQLPSDGTAEELYQQIQTEKKALISAGKIKKEKPLKEIEEDEIPFEIPESWKWVRLGDISRRIWAGGDKPSDFTKEKDEARTVPVVANGVNEDGILGYTSKPTADQNTITVAGRGTIGFTVIRSYNYCPVVRLIVIEQSNHIDPRYLKMFLQSMPESSVGSSIPQLTVPMIRPKLVPLPPLGEQTRIADKIQSYMEIIAN